MKGEGQQKCWLFFDPAIFLHSAIVMGSCRPLEKAAPAIGAMSQEEEILFRDMCALRVEAIEYADGTLMQKTNAVLSGLMNVRILHHNLLQHPRRQIAGKDGAAARIGISPAAFYLRLEKLHLTTDDLLEPGATPYTLLMRSSFGEEIRQLTEKKVSWEDMDNPVVSAQENIETDSEFVTIHGLPPAPQA